MDFEGKDTIDVEATEQKRFKLNFHILEYLLIEVVIKVLLASKTNYIKCQ